MSRQCSRCGEMKDDFPHKKSYCRQCGNEMCRDYKRRNKEKIAEYNKIYKAEHKEEVSVYNHNYNLENRESIQPRQTENQRKRKEKDENYKIATNMRTRLVYFLKKGCKVKFDEPIIEKYSCKPIFFKSWLEYQFKEDMNWDNYGQYWHIDHIKPCCMFDLTDEEQKKDSFHWSNLRPLKVIENQKKTNKLDEGLIEEYKLLSNKFLKEYNN